MLTVGIGDSAAARVHFLAAVFLSALTLVIPNRGRADFSDGLAAYDAGQYSQAVQYWNPLALAGDRDALVAMAELLEKGQGVRKDISAARRYYRLAAQAGSAVGQINLADYLERGAGGEADYVEALVWYGIAARKGNRWACAQYNRLYAGSGTVARQAADNLLQDILRDFPALQ
ncbi:TPR repeat protein [Limibacillus sp. MBR-115]|jgi:TPR repeat protein